MALDLRGFYPDTTPNQALGKIAETLQENKKYREEKAYRLQREKEAKLQQTRMFNIREINELTDLDKYKTGINALDAYSHKKLSDIANNAFTNYVNLDPAEMELRLKNDTNNYIAWHNAVSAKMKETENNMKDFNKTYPNVDYEKARQIANANLVGDFIDPQTGEEKIPERLDRNYVEDLHDPDILAELTNDISPLEKYYNSGLKPFHRSDFTSIQGVKSRDKYSGYYDPGKNYVTADAQGNPVIEVNHEIAPGIIKDGEPLKIIDQNQYENIVNTPGVSNSFVKKWNEDKSKEGRRELEKQYMDKTGKPMDDASREIAFRHWLYLDAKRNLPSYINRDEATVTPVTRISISGGGATGTNINDVYSRIDKAASDALENPKPSFWSLKGALKKSESVQNLALDESNLIVDFVNKSYPNKGQGDNPYKASELFILKGDDGKIRVYDSEENNLGVLPQAGINIKAQPGIKEKREAIKHGSEKQTMEAPRKKEISRKDIPAKAKASGYSEKEYESLLKKNGIIIKD